MTTLSVCVHCALFYLRFTVTFLLVTFVSLFVSNLLSELNIAHRLGSKLTFLLRPLKIPHFLAPAVVSSLIDIRAEHSIVYLYYSRGLVTDQFVVYYVLILSPLRMLHVLPTYVLPVAISALGVYGGLLYTLILAAKSAITFLVGYAYGRLRARNCIEVVATAMREKEYICEFKRASHASDKAKVIRDAVRKTLLIFRRLALRITTLSVIMMTLYLFKVFDLLAYYIHQVLSNALGKILDPEFLTLIVVGTLNPTLGLFTAGTLLSAGYITLKQALIGLILSGILFSLFFEFTRHSFPFYVSIYPARLAARLTLWHMLCNTVSGLVLIGLIAVLP